MLVIEVETLELLNCKRPIKRTGDKKEGQEYKSCSFLIYDTGMPTQSTCLYAVKAGNSKGFISEGAPFDGRIRRLEYVLGN